MNGKADCENCGHHYCMGQIPLLSSLSVDELREISKSIITKEYKKGEAIFNLGDRANGLYIVCHGKVKIYKNTLEGKEQIIYILSDGDFIGAFNLLKEDVFDFTAEALENTTISMLEKVAFDQVIVAKPEITLKVLEKAYERIMKVESLVERLSTKSLDAKVAALLLNLIDSFGEETEEGIVLKLSINREEMGSYTGIARETMTRKLKLFEEMGILKLQGAKVIIIRDVEKLKAFN